MICKICANAADTGRQINHDWCLGCDCKHEESREFLRKLRDSWYGSSSQTPALIPGSDDAVCVVVDGVKYKIAEDVMRRALHDAEAPR